MSEQKFPDYYDLISKDLWYSLAYVEQTEAGFVCLDGYFTAEQLRAIADRLESSARQGNENPKAESHGTE